MTTDQYATDLAFIQGLMDRIATRECLCPVWAREGDYPSLAAYDAACQGCPVHGSRAVA